MARAKQTNRAEARRRYRQTVLQDSGDAEGTVDEGTAGSPPANAPSSAVASANPAYAGAYSGSSVIACSKYYAACLSAARVR